jgi:ketosteroid isomerase-like protein
MEDATEMVRRLAQATNDHDLDALADCFAEDYHNETPVHPARGFQGRDQVRANWRQIFAGVPDIRARVRRTIADGTSAWSEWELSGTRRDGAQHLMRGVVIFEVADGRAASGRFYLEPVDLGDTDVDAAIQRAVGATS